MRSIVVPLIAGLTLATGLLRAAETERSARALSEEAERIAEEVTETLTPDADARKVSVNLTAKRIEIPKVLPAGKTAFVVRNVGRTKQNFEVEGPRVQKKFRFALAPQETKVFQMTLKPGNYRASCTVFNGKKRRMEVNLTVR